MLRSFVSGASNSVRLQLTHLEALASLHRPSTCPGPPPYPDLPAPSPAHPPQMPLAAGTFVALVGAAISADAGLGCCCVMDASLGVSSGNLLCWCLSTGTQQYARTLRAAPPPPPSAPPPVPNVTTPPSSTHLPVPTDTRCSNRISPQLLCVFVGHMGGLPFYPHPFPKRCLPRWVVRRRLLVCQPCPLRSRGLRPLLVGEVGGGMRQPLRAVSTVALFASRLCTH